MHLTMQEMLTNLVICNLPHPIAFNQARQKSLEQILKSWYIVYFQGVQYSTVQYSTVQYSTVL